MFVERSEARVRSARTAFVLGCLVPCGLLLAWAFHWRSDAHRDLAAASWGRAIGLAVRCERIEHVRPGCVRLSTCEIRDDGGPAVARFDAIEVEQTPREVRIRVPVFDATEEACEAIGRIAKSWLTEPARHGRDWLVDVAAVRWPDRAAGDRPSRPGGLQGEVDGGFRVECVSAGGERAVRIRREPATDDEVRIVRSVDDEAARYADGAARYAAGTARYAVVGRIDEPVPAACLLAAVGGRGGAVAGWCSGRADAVWSIEGWSGEVTGSLDRFDAAGIAAFFGSPLRLDGRARLDLASASFSRGRLARADAKLDIGSGAISQELLDRLVQVAQCRAGEAYRLGEAATSSPGVRLFDRLGCSIAIDAAGLTIRATDPAVGVVVAAGQNVIDPPAEPIAAERLAWAFAGRDARPLPETAATAWLFPLLPPSSQRR